MLCGRAYLEGNLSSVEGIEEGAIFVPLSGSVLFRLGLGALSVAKPGKHEKSYRSLCKLWLTSRGEGTSKRVCKLGTCRALCLTYIACNS